MDIFICLLLYLIRLLEMNNDDYDDEYFFCQQQFLQSCSECYILLEKYKLRTHIVGFNMEKEQIHYSYQYLQRRLTQRYTDIEKRLLQGLKNLHKNFLVAKGNALRAANNIFCNFRRRVGLLSNDPLSTLKYNKYDAQEKMLLETMLYNDKDNKQRIQALKAKLQEDLLQSTQQINQKYKLNDKIKQEFSKAFEVLDKCQCYTYKSMILSLSTWQANFDKLNGFLSVWQNIASIKAFEALTKKQIQSDQKNHDRQRQQRYHEDKTEEQLQQLMGNYPQNSAMREEYKKRLVQLRRNTVQKQKKLDNFGRMYNKRKTRPGILVNSFKNVSVIDYYQNVDSQKRHFSFKDEFKTFKANQSDQIMNDYRLTPYQMQKSFRSVEQIKTHMQRYQKSSILNYQWHYDRFGRGASFNLITNFNQQIQKKIEFECIRQVQLIQRDDIRKRQMFQRNAQLMKQAEKKQSILIGLKRLSDKNQLQWLNQRKYTPEYIPQLVQQDGEELHFSSDQQQPQTQIKAKQKVHQYNESDELLYSKVVNFAEELQEEIKIQSLIQVLQVPKIQKNIISTQIQNEPKQKATKKNMKNYLRKQSSSQGEGEDQQQLEFEQTCLQKQIIHKYFREYSRKIIRKETDPYYKKTYFFYYKHYSSIDPLNIAKYIDFQNLFLITSHEIILINKIFSNQQKIKCLIYLIQHNGEEEREEPLKQLINKIYTNTILTVKFQEVYLQDSSGQNVSFFIIGLISVLIKFNSMPEDLQFNDYILQGKEIVQDFKVYYYPQEYELQKQKLMKKFQSFAPKDFFAPLKKRENKPRPKQIANNDLNEMQGEIQNKQKVQVNNQIKPAFQQISSFKHENQQTIVSSINENVSQLKRSNSRQQIPSNIQQQMTALKVEQFNQEQQDDYQAL